MWRSKMAAQWRGKDVFLNTGNSKLMMYNTPAECDLNKSGIGELDMDAQSCMDHSILALFDDSTILSKNNIGMEEESETLLSALTEMLDCVEEDEGTLSPFDTLPDSDLLGQSEQKKETVEPSASHNLRPRPKPPHSSPKNQVEEENNSKMHEKRKNNFPPRFKKQPSLTKNKKTKPEVEVFTPNSIVSLVKLMHSYCLKLHKEDCGEMRQNPSVFSQEEVWRYERPNEESDEEINVVSDDEVLVRDTRMVDRVCAQLDNGLSLKSVLLNRNSSRPAPPKKNKRVSFGPVQVALFDELVEKVSNETSLNGVRMSGTESMSSEVPVNPAGTPLKPQTQPSERNDEAEVQKEKLTGEAKAKSLSLQQYRELRHTRQPLVEKQGNYTTKWPLVSEPPKELAPILSFQGQQNNISCINAPKFQPTFQKPENETKPSEVKLLTHPHCGGLKEPKTEPKVILTPNPPASVLTTTDKRTSGCKKCFKSKKPKLLCSDPPNPVLLTVLVPQPSSASNPSSESKLDSVRPENKALEDTCDEQVVSPKLKSLEELNMGNAKFKEELPDVSSSSSSQTGQILELKEPRSHLQSLNTVKSSLSPDEPVKPGIEAPDLTSLLEQFEETQDGDSYQCEASRPEPLSPPATEASESFISETFCTEITLRTQPARRQIPPSKAIQIIEPRPLLAKKSHTIPSNSSATHAGAHTYSYISTDHDYCGSVDQFALSTAQRNRGRSSQRRAEPQPSSHDSPSAREEQTEGTSVLICDSKSSWIKSEADTSIEKALNFPHRTCTEDVDEHRGTTCGLPTPPPSPPDRGRDKRRYRRSPVSDSRSSSSSSSTSRSPKRQRRHWKHSESSSCSSSPSDRVSYSSLRRCKLSYYRSKYSRSRSWSRSRSRTPSPQIHRRQLRDIYHSQDSRRPRKQKTKIQKLKAIDERRVVYVGRISRTMTNSELKGRFSQFGGVECVSLHFRDEGDHYGFVTFYNMEDAFAAIDNGDKLRKSDELPFDICFGGRRQFCSTNYADLDANRDVDYSPPKNELEDLDFDSLLKQAQRGVNR